jgi:hypothetical protein
MKENLTTEQSLNSGLKRSGKNPIGSQIQSGARDELVEYKALGWPNQDSRLKSLISLPITLVHQGMELRNSELYGGVGY